MAERKNADKDREAAEEKATTAFTKEQLMASERYRDKRDLLSALLDDGKQYATQTVDELIEKYMKGQVR